MGFVYERWTWDCASPCSFISIEVHIFGGEIKKERNASVMHIATLYISQASCLLNFKCLEGKLWFCKQWSEQSTTEELEISEEFEKIYAIDEHQSFIKKINEIIYDCETNKSWLPKDWIDEVERCVDKFKIWLD